MRKLKFLLVLFLSSVILYGCGNDNYAIEKEYWHIQKIAERVFKNPEATPPAQLANSVNALANFVSKFPKTPLSIESEFTIARLYLVKKEYSKARLQLEAMMEKYNQSKSICSEALFLIGNSYEIEDKWQSALSEYQKIISDYPITSKGLSSPIYIAQYYKIKHQPDKMLSAYQEAIQHYQSLSQKSPDSALSFNADALVVSCYSEIKDWPGALEALDSIMKRYKDKVDLSGALMNKALIYKNELKDKEKEKQALRQLIKDYPKSRLLNLANSLLKELEK